MCRHIICEGIWLLRHLRGCGVRPSDRSWCSLLSGSVGLQYTHTNLHLSIAAGMVPALYDDAEKEGLISNIRQELTAKGLPDSKDACWSAYVEKCRANLHVVLAMSPVGEALRTRCRNFPGLVNNTVIDWFEAWPEQVPCTVVLYY